MKGEEAFEKRQRIDLINLTLLRVLGKFPHSTIEINQPIGCLDPVKHVWGVTETGQPAVTHVKLLSCTDSSR